MERNLCDLVVKKLTSQSLDHAAFTDGTGTAGTIAFTSGKLPPYALVLGWKCVISEAFTGDTSGVILVGTSGDDNAYTGDTDLSCYTAATIGSMAPVDTAVTTDYTIPYVEVTGAADWGNVTAGTCVVTIYYLELGL